MRLARLRSRAAAVPLRLALNISFHQFQQCHVSKGAPSRHVHCCIHVAIVPLRRETGLSHVFPKLIRGSLEIIDCVAWLFVGLVAGVQLALVEAVQ